MDTSVTTSCILVLLDGIGVARVLLPVLKHLPQVRAVVIFHGVTRLRKADRKLFEQLGEDDVRYDFVATYDDLLNKVMRG